MAAAIRADDGPLTDNAAEVHADGVSPDDIDSTDDSNLVTHHYRAGRRHRRLYCRIPGRAGYTIAFTGNTVQRASIAMMICNSPATDYRGGDGNLKPC